MQSNIECKTGGTEEEVDERKQNQVTDGSPWPEDDKPLWIHIARFLPFKDGIEIIRKIPELSGVAQFVMSERNTLEIISFLRDTNEYRSHPLSRLDLDTDPSIQQIENRKDFWCCWTLKFDSWPVFFDYFCKYAGIRPSKGVLWKPEYSCASLDQTMELAVLTGFQQLFFWVSADKKISLCRLCSRRSRQEESVLVIGQEDRFSPEEFLSHGYRVFEVDLLSRGSTEELRSRLLRGHSRPQPWFP